MHAVAPVEPLVRRSTRTRKAPQSLSEFGTAMYGHPKTKEAKKKAPAITKSTKAPAKKKTKTKFDEAEPPASRPAHRKDPDVGPGPGASVRTQYARAVKVERV